MILQVFKNIGDKLSIADTYASMIAVYSGQLYPEKKAAGSIGGAVNGKTIILRNGYYERVK